MWNLHEAVYIGEQITAHVVEPRPTCVIVTLLLPPSSNSASIVQNLDLDLQLNPFIY